MTRTNRTFTEVETKEVFVLFTSHDASKYHLISDGSKELAKGTSINGFYISAHTPQTIRLNTGKEVKLNTGEFYNLKEDENGIIEEVTHKKYAGFKRFTKV